MSTATSQADFDREYVAMRQIIRDLQAQVSKLQQEVMVLRATVVSP